MPAYWDARSKIMIRSMYKKFTICSGHSRAKYGWQGFWRRGGRLMIMEGPQSFSFRSVEFPTFEQAGASLPRRNLTMPRPSPSSGGRAKWETSSWMRRPTL